MIFVTLFFLKCLNPFAFKFIGDGRPLCFLGLKIDKNNL